MRLCEARAAVNLARQFECLRARPVPLRRRNRCCRKPGSSGAPGRVFPEATNEELEASKEELQSLNEELNAVNSQLERKVAELEESGDDLRNLLAGSDIATIFLDARMRIKWFTPAIQPMSLGTESSRSAAAGGTRHDSAS